MEKHNEKENTNFVRSDRLMTRREIETAAANMKEVERAKENSGYDNIFTDIILGGFMLTVVGVIIYGIIVHFLG